MRMWRTLEVCRCRAVVRRHSAEKNIACAKREGKGKQEEGQECGVAGKKWGLGGTPFEFQKTCPCRVTVVIVSSSRGGREDS